MFKYTGQITHKYMTELSQALELPACKFLSAITVITVPSSSHSDLTVYSRLTLLIVDPRLTKWQMSCRGFLTSASKQRRAGTPWKPGHNHSFHPPQLYLWRTYWHERKVCRKGDRSAGCLARTRVEKQRMEAPLSSSSTLTLPSVSSSLRFIFFRVGLFGHLSSAPSSKHVIVLPHRSSFSCLAHLFFHLPVSCVSRSSSLIPYPSSPISLS